MHDIDKIARLVSEDPEVKGEENSQLSSAVAMDVLSIMRDELSKFGCRLSDYYVNFNASGFDITKIKVACAEPGRVINVIKAAEPEVRHEFSNSPTKYAYMAANINIAKRINDDLGLDYNAYSVPDADSIMVAVREPKEEKPLPPEQMPSIPDEVVAGVDEPFEPEPSGDLGVEEPIELPAEVGPEPAGEIEGIAGMTPEEAGETPTAPTSPGIEEIAEPIEEVPEESEELEAEEKPRPGREF